MKRAIKIPLIAVSVCVALALLIVAAGLFLVAGMQRAEDGTQLAQGKVTLVAGDVAISYIVELADGRVALVDAGMDSKANAIRHALQKNGFGAQDVAAILLTHGHGDHIAGAKAFPGAKIYVHQDDADLVEGRRVADSLFARLRGREPVPTGLTVDFALKDGESISIGGTPVEVFALPGHTRGSAAYLIHGVLFLGDSAAARSDGKITAAPPVFSADRERNKRALHTLASALSGRRDEIRALAFGHQGPLAGLGPLLEWSGPDTGG